MKEKRPPKHCQYREDNTIQPRRKVWSKKELTNFKPSQVNMKETGDVSTIAQFRQGKDKEQEISNNHKLKQSHTHCYSINSTTFLLRLVKAFESKSHPPNLPLSQNGQGMGKRRERDSPKIEYVLARQNRLCPIRNVIVDGDVVENRHCLT